MDFLLLFLLLSHARLGVGQRVRKDPKNGVTDPGWKCQISLTAQRYWKAIKWRQFANHNLQQFQCTWRIDGPSGSKIAVNLPKINFKSVSQNIHCGRDFLQLIDQGENKGRFCKQSQVTDYISFGNRMRIDVQGEYQLPHMLRAKKDPMIINYRAMTSPASGFKKVSTSNQYAVKPILSDNDQKARTREGSDDSGEESESWKVVKFVIIIASCLLLLIIIVVVVRRFYCVGKKKNEDDDVESDDVITSHQTGKQGKPLPMTSYELPAGMLSHQNENKSRGSSTRDSKISKLDPSKKEEIGESPKEEEGKFDAGEEERKKKEKERRRLKRSKAKKKREAERELETEGKAEKRKSRREEGEEKKVRRHRKKSKKAVEKKKENGKSRSRRENEDEEEEQKTRKRRRRTPEEQIEREIVKMRKKKKSEERRRRRRMKSENEKYKDQEDEENRRKRRRRRRYQSEPE